MICLWNWLVFSGMFTQIDHKFLVSGHTYLLCDHDFAQIEKKKRSQSTFLMIGMRSLKVLA